MDLDSLLIGKRITSQELRNLFHVPHEMCNATVLTQKNQQPNSTRYSRGEPEDQKKHELYKSYFVRHANAHCL